MEIALRAIIPLLPKLGDLLVGEYTLEKRVRKNIESLVTELTLMHAALRKVSRLPPDQLDEGVKIWAGNVRELSYQMEEAVDAFMVRVEDCDEPSNPKNRVKKLLKKTTRLFKKGKDLHRISNAIEEAVGQAKQLAELRQRYEHGLAELRQRYEREIPEANAGATIDPRVMGLYTDVTELVGIEDTREELINMLIGGDDWLKHPLKMVSIVGFGGLGKTTLAKAVYDKIKGEFDCGAFVSVSQTPDMKKVFKDILYKLDKEKYASIHNATRDIGHFIDELSEFLNNKTYIIVIDDIWDEKVWQLINCAFPKSSVGSRLITTTRIISISKACCSSSDDIIYKMEPLPDDVSRRLFCKRVFSLENGCPHELEQVSRDILKKCGGIPLAIITIASLLASNRQIKAKEHWYDLLNSIGSGLTEHASVEEMKKILLFSYYDLPSHLKPCMLHLSTFPEDYKIMRDQLIWKWIAEGFVHSENQETCLYELGESYFIELINRSMLQPVGIDNQERIEACRVHDMVLDLICCLSSEENFVTVLDGSSEKNVPNSQRKVRRLSIQKSKVDMGTTSMPHVRSLTIFTNGFDLVPLISRLQVLRVLDLQDCAISGLGFIGKLIHLRYLGLNCKSIGELPMEIGNLQFLQTLKLQGATSIKELPSSIVRIRHLMCLYIDGIKKLPSGLGNLASLEVLESLSCIFNQDKVKELGHLTKLRVLGISWQHLNERLDKVLVDSLSNLHKLQVLDIFADGGRVNLMREGWVPPPQLRRLCIHGPASLFLTLPAWINPSSLPLLSYLNICVQEVRPEDIWLLGMLPSLRDLRVFGKKSFKEMRATEMLVVAPDAFPCATNCQFIGIAAVPSIFPQGAAPRLKWLHFAFPAMWISRGDIYLGMGHLPSLEKVEVQLLRAEASTEEVNEARATLRAAVEDHPNRPTFTSLN